MPAGSAGAGAACKESNILTGLQTAITCVHCQFMSTGSRSQVVAPEQLHWLSPRPALSGLLYRLQLTFPALPPLAVEE